MKQKNKNYILIGLGLTLGGVVGYLANSRRFGDSKKNPQKSSMQQRSGRHKKRGLSSSFQRGVLHARKIIEEQTSRLEAAHHQ